MPNRPPPMPMHTGLPIPTAADVNPTMLRDLANRLDDTPAGGSPSLMMGEASNTLRAAADKIEGPHGKD